MKTKIKKPKIEQSVEGYFTGYSYREGKKYVKLYNKVKDINILIKLDWCLHHKLNDLKSDLGLMYFVIIKPISKVWRIVEKPKGRIHSKLIRGERKWEVRYDDRDRLNQK